MNLEEFVLLAFRDNSLMWDEKTLKKVAFLKASSKVLLTK